MTSPRIAASAAALASPARPDAFDATLAGAASSTELASARKLTAEDKRQIDDFVRSEVLEVARSLQSSNIGQNDPATITPSVRAAEAIEGLVRRRFGNSREAQNHALFAILNPVNLTPLLAANPGLSSEITAAAAMIFSDLRREFGR